MKRLFFALAAILFSLGLLTFSFLRSAWGGTISIPTQSGALSGSGAFSILKNAENWEIVSGEREWNIATAIKTSSLNAIIAPAAQSPVRISRNTASEQEVSIDRGRYVFSSEDSLESMVIKFPTFSIKQISRGTFFVDTSDTSNIRIYSVSSILSVSLYSAVNKEEQETEFMVFPSMLFEHDPKLNDELKSADILRVATIHSLTYAPLFLENDFNPQIVKSTEVKDLFTASINFLRKQDMQASESAQALFSQKMSYETELFDTFPILFINSEKRAALLQNVLFKNLQELFFIALKTDCSKGGCDATKTLTTINSNLSDLRSISEAEYQKGQELVKSAYYIAYAKTSSSTEISNRVNPFVLLLKRVFQDQVHIDSLEYTTLSSIYRDEMLTWVGESNVSEKLDTYLRGIISAKTIRKTDFLSFVFFLKEYLSHPMPKISTSELDIFYYLVSISNEYYAILASDDEKFSLLSVYFYNYEKIVAKITDSIVSRLFQTKDAPLVLKSDFVRPDGQAKLDEGFASSMGLIAKAFQESDPYFGKQLSLYHTFLNSGKDSNIADRFSIFQTTMVKFQDIESILSNYKNYTDKMALKEDVRGAQGVVFNNNTFPSVADLKTYLSQFSGMNPDSLEIIGWWETDGFYLISFTVDQYRLSLKFIPNGHTIEDVVFSSPDGQVNRGYRKFSISLDEKKKASEEGGAKRLDFSKFFQNTFFAPDNTGAQIQPAGDSGDINMSNNMTQEMKVFADRELIGKDFHNITGVFPVTLANIYAEVKDGEYDISVSWVVSRLHDAKGTETVEFSGKYLFSQSVHAFYRLSLRVIGTEWTKDFGGTSIQITPSRIDLENFEKVSETLPQYIRVLRNVRYSGSEKATFDLSRQTVIIGANEYPLDS